MQETWVHSWGREDPFKKGMATHPSFLAWGILWMEEPGGFKSTGSQRVQHNWNNLAHSTYAEYDIKFLV